MNRIQDIRHDGYAWPGMKGDSEAITKQINNLKYIEHLAQVTQTDVSQWPVDIFINSGGRVYSERQKLNEKFFEFKATADKAPKAAPVVSLLAVKKIEQGMLDIVQRKIDAEGLQLSQRNRELEQLSGKLTNTQRDIIYHSITISSLKKVKDQGFNLMKQIESVIADGFWTLLEEANTLQFISMPTSITYFNKLQARNNAVHLGKLRLVIGVNNDCVLTAKIYKHEGAAHPLRNPHPHVSVDNKICFGELKAAFEKAAAQMNILEVTRICRTIVQTYNEDDSFARIYDFDRGDGGVEEDEEVLGELESEHQDEEPEDENYDDDDL